MKAMQYGILGQSAPEFNVDYFIDAQGREEKPLKLSDFKDSVKILFCFQAGCPSCHTKGLPTLQKLVARFTQEMTDKKLFIAAIQTAFEGRDANNQSQLRKIQEEYQLAIPFGHDAAHPRPSTMMDYRNGGTPWFIVIDRNNNVIHNDFSIDLTYASMLIEQAIAGENTVPKAKAYIAHDNVELGRYEIPLDENNSAIVTYVDKDGLCYLNHTEVPSALRGKGYGAVMMEAVLEKIESQGKKIVPVCSYARHYSHRYHRWAHLLAS